MKKIVGAAKYHSQSSPFPLKLDWIGCATYLESNSQMALTIYFFNHFIKNPQTTNALTFLTHNNSAIRGVGRKLKINNLRTISYTTRWHSNKPNKPDLICYSQGYITSIMHITAAM